MGDMMKFWVICTVIGLVSVVSTENCRAVQAMGDEAARPVSSESCYLDGNEVLLYKVINWWNTSLPEEDTLLCGEPLLCRHKGRAIVRYDKVRQILFLSITDQFRDIVSIFKECSACFGPSRLECTWLNPRYFSGKEAGIIPGAGNRYHRFHFSGVLPEEARLIKEAEKDLAFMVEGEIGGLLMADGRIALHRTGEFLKPCPPSIPETKEHEITLTLANGRTGEILARYTVTYDNKPTGLLDDGVIFKD